MASLSAKQLGMAWINSMLQPERISLDREQLETLNGGPITDARYEDAVNWTKEELAKMRVRFQDYVTKYCDGAELPLPTPDEE